MTSSDFLHDLRLAIRRLAKEWRFSATLILILSLGIGSSVAVFSLMDAVALRSLPFEEADRLVRIYSTNPSRNVQFFSTPTFAAAAALLAADIRRLVLGAAARLWVAGTLGGLALAWALSRLIRTSLYEFEPTEISVYAAVTALLAAIVAAAAWFPARRAARIDPATALHHD